MTEESQKVLERIRKWQEEPVFHQLTCANDSSHALLKGTVLEGKIALVCPTCDYAQHYIPDMFWTDEFDTAYLVQKNLLDSLDPKK